MPAIPLHHKSDFETLNNLLSLEITHAVFGTTPDLTWKNRIPHCRLFFIHDTGPGPLWGGTIRNLSVPDAPVVTLRSGHVYFVPGNHEIEGAFRRGLFIIGYHFRLEIFAGYDVFAGTREIRSRDDQRAVIKELALYAKGSLDLAEIVRIRGLVHASSARFIDRSVDDLRRLLVLRSRYQAIFECMETRPSAQLTVHDLSRLMGRKREQLSRSFARDMGITLKGYLTRHLASKVCERLASSAVDINQVAQEFQFSSVGYFCRFVRKQTGKTPLRYRQMRLQPHGLI